MKDLHFKVSDEEHKNLVNYCKLKERTVSDVMRELIRKLLEAENLSPDRR
jgi:hypothetical protein